jgi:hypothetical protein
MAIPTFPERTLESEDSPPTPSPFPELVAETNAIIGEDARAVSFQRIITGKETGSGLWLLGGATARTISLLSIAYASLVVSTSMQIDRAKAYSFYITYTPGVTGAFPILYPQFSGAQVPEAFAFTPAKASTLVPFAGPTDPPSFGRVSSGHYYENLFEAFAASLVAATPLTVVWTVKPDDDITPRGATAVRLACRDSNNVTAGAISI